MLIEENNTSIIRNLDSIKCKIRDAETDDLLELSLSDLTNAEKRTVLSNCSDAELQQVITELAESYCFVIQLLADNANGENRMVLYPLAFGLSEQLRRFGDEMDIVLPENIKFPVNEQEQAAEPKIENAEGVSNDERKEML